MSQPKLQTTAFAVIIAILVGGCAQNMVMPEGNDELGELGQLKRDSPADVYVQLAVGYMRQRQFGEALKNAKKAVTVDPNRSSAQNVIGLIYQRLGENSLAETAFQRALKLDARDPYVLNAYGSFLCGDQRFEAADAMFQRAVENPLYRTPEVALTNAGICAQSAGDAAQAETNLRRALQADKRFAPALLGMANISLERGNPLSARAYLQRYAEVAAHTAESLWLGIRAEEALGDRNQVSNYALQLRSQFPDSEQVQLLRESRSP